MAIVHYIKNARFRSYSGPQFSRIFLHSNQDNSENGQFLRSGKRYLSTKGGDMNRWVVYENVEPRVKIVAIRN